MARRCLNNFLISSFQLIVITAAPMVAPMAQAPPPAGFPGKAPQGPPAEIVRFEATPRSIEPGESATLRWEALNTYSLEIEPGLGAVATRGSRTLSPAATTTTTRSRSRARVERRQPQ